MTESSAFGHLVGVRAKRRKWESLLRGASETEKNVVRVSSGCRWERQKETEAQGGAGKTSRSDLVIIEVYLQEY